ncbi:MAG: succinate dehydrogenase / fumarate reductase, rane anchor subunit [Sphingomonadales bacterium]|jgi:succinate dehydrogenase / fumarate reductase membrane anchor subunit|nr:succinate dehydrogenase / fumarate reductase, rane anchor subunit [Sphingomonadales bacterium]
METETPIAQARGLGSAREGAGHWWQERTSSIAALILYFWLLASLLRLGRLDYATVREWLADPWAAVPMLLLIAVTFRHLRDGLQVVIDDYVHDEGNRFFTLLLLNFAAVAAGALALFSVLRIALAAGAAAAGAPVH